MLSYLLFTWQLLDALQSHEKRNHEAADVPGMVWVVFIQLVSEPVRWDVALERSCNILLSTYGEVGTSFLQWHSAKETCHTQEELYWKCLSHSLKWPVLQTEYLHFELSKNVIKTASPSVPLSQNKLMDIKDRKVYLGGGNKVLQSTVCTVRTHVSLRRFLYVWWRILHMHVSSCIH